MSVALSLSDSRQQVPVILVVDDEPSICAALTIALRRAGYEGISAGGREEAESILRSRHVDGLVLDLRMPDGRGDELFHMAYGLQGHLEFATVFITGDVTEKAAKLVAACECPLVQKPFDLTQVLAEVARLVPNRKSNRA